jgi:hypothetical protein
VQVASVSRLKGMLPLVLSVLPMLHADTAAQQPKATSQAAHTHSASCSHCSRYPRCSCRQ